MKNTYKVSTHTVRAHQINDNLLHLRVSPGYNNFQAGQFFMISLPGFGEAPFTPINYPNSRNIEFVIKKAGSLTEKLFKLKDNEQIFLRGPYGNHFPFKDMFERNVILIAGGCGIAPIYSAVLYLYRNTKHFKDLKLFYGTQNQKQILFKKQLQSMSNQIETLITVSQPSTNYHGNIGFVDKLIDKNTVPENSIIIACGPSAMYDSIIKKLLGLGIQPKNIYLQLERRMHCGTGHCQHCSCGDQLVCQDGPIFSYKQLINMNTKI